MACHLLEKVNMPLIVPQFDTELGTLAANS
jgi:hypothetical protein